MTRRQRCQKRSRPQPKASRKDSQHKEERMRRACKLPKLHLDDRRRTKMWRRSEETATRSLTRCRQKIWYGKSEALDCHIDPTGFSLFPAKSMTICKNQGQHPGRTCFAEWDSKVLSENKKTVLAFSGNSNGMLFLSPEQKSQGLQTYEKNVVGNSKKQKGSSSQSGAQTKNTIENDSLLYKTRCAQQEKHQKVG